MRWMRGTNKDSFNKVDPVLDIRLDFEHIMVIKYPQHHWNIMAIAFAICVALPWQKPHGFPVPPVSFEVWNPVTLERFADAPSLDSTTTRGRCRGAAFKGSRWL